MLKIRLCIECEPTILFTFNVHVQSDWDQYLWLSSILMNRGSVSVIKAEWECSHFLVDHSVPVDGSGLRHCIQVRGVGHGGHNGGWLDRLGSLGRGGGAGVSSAGLLGLVGVLSAIEDVLYLVGQEEGDGAGGHMLGVSHLHQLVSLICGQVSPNQTWVLLVQSSSVQSQIISNLLIKITTNKTLNKK